eukprot:scpid84680/ scgid25904/ 
MDGQYAMLITKALLLSLSVPVDKEFARRQASMSVPMARHTPNGFHMIIQKSGLPSKIRGALAANMLSYLNRTASDIEELQKGGIGLTPLQHEYLREFNNTSLRGTVLTSAELAELQKVDILNGPHRGAVMAGSDQLHVFTRRDKNRKDLPQVVTVVCPYTAVCPEDIWSRSTLADSRCRPSPLHKDEKGTAACCANRSTARMYVLQGLQDLLETREEAVH